MYSENSKKRPTDELQKIQTIQPLTIGTCGEKEKKRRGGMKKKWEQKGGNYNRKIQKCSPDFSPQMIKWTCDIYCMMNHKSIYTHISHFCEISEHLGLEEKF